MNQNINNRWLRIGLVCVLVMMLFFSINYPAKAFEINKDGIIDAKQTVNDDIFITAEKVVVDGTVNGMLVAMGNDVTINGTINGDVLIFSNLATFSDKATVKGNVFFGGQNLKMNGKVEGSIFAGGNTCQLESETQVNRNVFFGGFSLSMDISSKIGKDLAVGGYQAIVKGEVGRDLHMSGAALQLDGKVGRDVIADVSEPGSTSNTYWMQFMPFSFERPATITPGLHVGSEAKIVGKLTYTSPVKQDSAVQSTPAGGIVYQTPVPAQNGAGNERIPLVRSPFMIFLNWILDRIRDLVTLFALGALALWLIPGIFKQVVDKAWMKPLPAVGWGLLTIIVGYVGAFLVAVILLGVVILLGLLTLGGLTRTIFGAGFSSLGLVLTIFTLLVSYGSKLVVAYLGGQWLYQKIFPHADLSKYGHKLIGLLIGVVIYVILSGIPFIGWLFGLAATLLGVGAMWLYYRSTLPSKKNPVIIPPVIPDQPIAG